MSIERIEKALRDAREIQSQLDNAKGQRDAGLQQLKAEHNVESLGEARELVGKLRRRLVKQEKQATELLEAFYETYGSML